MHACVALTRVRCSKDISRSYGVLVDDEGDDMYGAALRGLFIVDPQGKIRSMQVCFRVCACVCTGRSPAA